VKTVYLSLKQQTGFFAVLAVIMILILGCLGVVVSYLFFSSANATVNEALSAQAFYLAQSGIEHATHLLLTPNLTIRNACAGLSVTNSLSSGNYSVSSTGPSSPSSPTSLSAALTATATSIPVVSTSGYQASGRIRIDQEFINYASLDSTHFIGVRRGVDGSLAASHAANAVVGQYQCNLSSQGGSPNLTFSTNTAGGKRVVAEGVQLPEGWVVGDNTGTSWVIARWNNPTEMVWTSQTSSITPYEILYGVSMISNADIWVVGAKATALHYNGSSWTEIKTGITGGDTLVSVSGISSQEAWTISAQGKVYQWSGGATWTSPANFGSTLNSISMLDSAGNGTATTGWVVGTKKMAHLYNGSSWSSTNTGITVDLYGVSTLSATDAWAAGLSGAIFHWAGTSWATVSTPTTANLAAISMISSNGVDTGWAVGSNSAALYYNGSSWTLENTGLASGLTLNQVVTVSATEAWVVTSAGRIYEWNGSSWNLITTLSTGLNGIDILHPNTHPKAAWSETYA